MATLPRLFIATRNRHKTAEIRALLAGRYEVTDAHAVEGLPEIEETGDTFLDNARLKALGISGRIGGLVLSDDSGLEVDALGGSPGVFSSSYGGVEGDHARNNLRLVKEMAGHANRRARFRCTMVLARDGRELAHFIGSVEGRLLEEPSGAEGFGYDPLFVPEGYEKSFAELGAEIKNRLSHRARALVQAVDFLAKWDSGLPAAGNPLE
jgi:XTP/dITP diphosphohydrolase